MVYQYTLSHQNIIVASLSKSHTSKSVVQALYSQKNRENQINGSYVFVHSQKYIFENPDSLLVLSYQYSHHMKNNLSSLLYDTQYKASTYV